MSLKIIKNFLSQRRVQLAIIAIVTFLAFSNTLQNKLTWDDHLLLQQWNDIKSFNHIPEILMGSAPETFGKIYRPLRGLIYVFDYALWKDNPFFYHLQALLVHISITLIIYLILEKMFKKRYLIFFVSLIFGVHTLHTEQIDYIAASMDSFGILFFFLSFYFYVSRKTILSVLFATLAIFTYELTITLPIFFVLYDIFFERDNFMKIFENKKFIKTYFLFFLPLGVFFFLRTAILHVIARTDYLGYSFYLTMLIMVKVFAQYVGLLFLPINLTANHILVGNFPVTMLPYDKLDPVLNQKIYDIDFLISASVLISLFVLMVFLYRRLSVVSFSIAWFFLSLAPVSYIIPSGGAMAERYTYIGSFGFILAIVYILFKLAGNSNGQKNFVALILIVVTLLYSFATFERNKVWKDDISLFTDMEKKAPGNLKALYSLGSWYANDKNYEKSAFYFKKAVKKSPEFWEARYYLAGNYLKLGKYGLAVEELNKVLEYNPSFAPAINALSLLSPQSSQSGSFGNTRLNGKISYSIYPGITFEYPSSFNLIKTERGVILKDKSSDFTIALEPNAMQEGITVQDYLNNQKASYGTLVNQGLAQVPSVDYAYVKVWSLDSSQQMMQFFLFSSNKVLEVRVSPSNSPMMKEFDKIVGSLKFQ